MDASPEPSDTMFDADMASAPQPMYDMLRDNSPVFRSEFGVVLSRYEDVQFALRRWELFSSKGVVEIGNVRPLIPLGVDPPDHVKYRRLLDPLFAPRQVARLEGDVRSLVNELIDDFIADGEVEFNRAFAIPLPCTVFLRLLGLPIEDLDVFLEFKDNIIRPGGADIEANKRILEETGQRIYTYFGTVIDARAAEPRDDLITRFLEAEIDGARLSREDILDICYLFLLAGLDTVTASLGCAVTYLAQHPEHRDALVRDPSLVPAAIEELLRWETPVPGVPRVLTQDVEIAGEPLKAGEAVTCLLGSANLDGGEFAQPGGVDFAREPNRHLAFGGGVHRCLGSHLARLEMQVALNELHRRIPDYAIKPGDVPRYGAGIRTVEYLPLVFTPAPGA
jgi:cytochrome P450